MASAAERAAPPAGPAASPTVPPDLGSDRELVARLDFESALELGTANALCLYLRKHADHPLADEARRILRERYRVDGTEENPCPQSDR